MTAAPDDDLQVLNAVDVAVGASRLRSELRDRGVVLVRGALDPEEVTTVRRLVLGVLECEGWVTAGSSRPVPAQPPRRIGDAAFLRCITEIMSSEAIHLLAHGGSIGHVATGILSEPAFVHPRKMARLAYPSRLSPLDVIPAHQDLAYVKGERDTLTFWIPLGDIPRESGGLCFVEGSHRGGLVPTAPNEEGRFQCNAADVDDGALTWSTADYRTGDVLIFHAMTLHRGGLNTTDEMRLSLDCRASRLAGTVNADQLLPPYHPGVPGWASLAAGWSKLDFEDVPTGLDVEAANAPAREAAERETAFS